MYRTAKLAILAASIYPAWLSAESAAPRPAFEVASVKVDTVDGPSDYAPHRSGNRIVMHNTTLDAMVVYAWNIDAPVQMSAEDSRRLRKDQLWFDVEAETKGEVTDDQLRLMFQTLLEDRFQFICHREVRQAPTYDLTVLKAGKLTPTRQAVNITYFGRLMPVGSAGATANGSGDGMHLLGKAATAGRLAGVLAAQLRAPVRDQTGLTGTYDFDVRFAARNNSVSPSPDGFLPPTLETAIQDSLGLKLVKSAGPVEFFIIDHIGKLTPN